MLRSENRRQFWSRLAIVSFFCLFVHATIVAETGGGGVFKFWRPDRMRIILIELVVIGIAAYEFRVKDGKVEEEPTASAGTPPPVVPPPVVPTPVVPPVAPPPVVPPVAPPSVVPPVAPPPLETSSSAAPSLNNRAKEAWQEARKIQHSFIPDMDSDYAYLRLLNESARFGHAIACFKLGDYAFRRGTFVEAYYWLKMAKAAGAVDTDEWLTECLRQWRVTGFEPEYENVTKFFSERQGMLGRAALRLDSGVDAVHARARLREMVQSGDREAEVILKLSENTPLHK